MYQEGAEEELSGDAFHPDASVPPLLVVRSVG